MSKKAIAGLVVFLAASVAGAVSITPEQYGGWVGTATTALDMVAQVISFGTDPADTGDIRLENNTAICWEKATPGTDACLSSDDSDIMHFTGIGGGVNGTVYFHSTNSTKLQLTDGNAYLTGNDVSGISMAATGGSVFSVLPGYIVPITLSAAVPAEPVACASGTFGATVLVNDTNDGAVSHFCYCGQQSNDSTYDWLKMDGTACPFF